MATRTEKGTSATTTIVAPKKHGTENRKKPESSTRKTAEPVDLMKYAPIEKPSGGISKKRSKNEVQNGYAKFFSKLIVPKGSRESTSSFLRSHANISLIQKTPIAMMVKFLGKEFKEKGIKEGYIDPDANDPRTNKEAICMLTKCTHGYTEAIIILAQLIQLTARKKRMSKSHIVLAASQLGKYYGVNVTYVPTPMSKTKKQHSKKENGKGETSKDENEQQDMEE